MEETKEYVLKNKEDDEISLVDLLVVLLKHRRLIIWGTFLSTLIVAGGIVGYGLLFKGVSFQKETTTLRLVINPAATNLSPNILDLLKNEFSNYITQQKAAISTGYTKFKKDNFKYTTTDNIISLSYSHPLKDQEQVILFLQELKILISKDIESIMLQIAQETYNNFLLFSKENFQNNMEFVSLLPSAIAAFSYIKKPFPLFLKEDMIYDEPKNANTITLTVVLFIAFLFFYVFLAFVLEAIENLKRDQVTMARIQEALNYSRKKK